MRIVIVVLLCGLYGCATEQLLSWSASGGSRADATIELAYQYNAAKVIPITDQSQADSIALSRCQAWGYTDTQPFGMQTSRCQQYGTGIYESTCLDMLVTLEYQCIGRGDN